MVMNSEGHGEPPTLLLFICSFFPCFFPSLFKYFTLSSYFFSIYISLFFLSFFLAVVFLSFLSFLLLFIICVLFFLYFFISFYLPLSRHMNSRPSITSGGFLFRILRLGSNGSVNRNTVIPLRILVILYSNTDETHQY